MSTANECRGPSPSTVGRQQETEHMAELIERTSQALCRMRAPGLKPVPLDLTMAQGRCLWTIARRENCTLRELSEQLGVRPSTASPLVEGLVQAGLVQRRDDPRDRRALRLSLTDKGCDLHLKRAAARREQVSLFLEPLNQTQRETMLDALTTFNEIVREAEQNS
jgi:DNA-binding MarR family transcriptional regulator